MNSLQVKADKTEKVLQGTQTKSDQHSRNKNESGSDNQNPPPAESNREVSFSNGKHSAAPVKEKKGQVYLKGVSESDVEFSIRHMSLMLRSGLPLPQSIGVIIEQVTDSRLKSTYSILLEDVNAGMTMADSMKKFPKVFSEVIRSIVRVSEQTGTLETNLIFLADYIKKEYELKRKVSGAMLYPLIILGMTGIEMLGVVFYILPKLEVLFSSFDNLPPFSVMVVNTAKTIRENVLFLVIAVFLLIFCLKQLSKTTFGKKIGDKLAITFPIIKNLNRKRLLSSFSRTLGLLLESSIPIATALKTSHETIGNYYYKEALNEIAKEVKGGKQLSESMLKYQNLFPISYIRIIEEGEKTGTLEENLEYLYESYSSEVEEMANNLVTLLEPLLLIIAGLLIGLLMVTIIAPIYQFTGSINQ